MMSLAPQTGRLALVLLALVEGSGLLAQDKLRVADPSGTPGSAVAVPISLEGTAPITAIQMDVIFAPDQVTLGSAQATTSTTNHQADSAELSAGTRRVVVYSRTNSPLPKDIVLDLPLVLQVASPAGGPTIRVQNVTFTKADGTRVIGSTTHGPVTEWRFANFSSNEWNNPSLVGDDVVTGSDGIPNLLKAVLNGTRGANDSDKLPKSQVLKDQGTNRKQLEITYRQSRNTSGLTISAESSPDLQTWTGVTPQATGNSDLTTIEMRARVDVEGSDRRFLRLKVQR